MKSSLVIYSIVALLGHGELVRDADVDSFQPVELWGLSAEKPVGGDGEKKKAAATTRAPTTTTTIATTTTTTTTTTAATTKSTKATTVATKPATTATTTTVATTMSTVPKQVRKVKPTTTTTTTTMTTQPRKASPPVTDAVTTVPSTTAPVKNQTTGAARSRRSKKSSSDSSKDSDAPMKTTTTTLKTVNGKPSLKNVYFTEQVHYNSYFDRKSSRGLNVTAERNIPLQLGLEGAKGTYVCFEKPTMESGCTDSADVVEFRPRARVGESQDLTVYYTNKTRDFIGNYTLTVVSGVSGNPYLGNVRVSGGRLDPTFKPHQMAYYVRCPPGATSFNLDLDALDFDDTEIYIDGKRFTGRGSHSVSFPRGAKSKNVEIRTVSADGKQSSNYVLTAVRQLGGSTLLDEFSPVGAEFDRKFDPFVAGDYTVSEGLRGGLPDVSWMAFKAKPSNKKATVTVDGLEVDKDGVTPYFYTPPGEKHRFRVAVRTPENPVEEEYFFVVDRSHEKLKAGTLRKLAAGLGLVSGGLTMGSAGSFLGNSSLLQFASVTNRINGIPEGYDTFSYNFHPWNLQNIPGVPQCEMCDEGKPWSRGFNFFDKNAQTSKRIEAASNSVRGDGKLVPPYRFDEDFDEEFRVALDGAEMDAYDAALDVVDAADTGADTVDSVDVAAASDDLAESLGMLVKDASGDWSPIGGVAMHIREIASEVEPELAVRSLRALATASKDNLDVRTEMVRQLESRMKFEAKMKHFVSSILFVTAVVLGVALLYGILWVSYLRHPSSDHFFELRQDFPSVLEPKRFWGFVADFAFIMFSQSCLGVLFAGLPRTACAKIFGTTLYRNHIWILAGVVFCLVPLLHIVLGVLVLAQHGMQKDARKKFVFARELGEYRFASANEIKAQYNKFSWIPLFGSLFNVEVKSVAPVLRSKKDTGSHSLTFVEDNTPLTVPLFSADPKSIRGNRDGYEPVAGEAQSSVKCRPSDGYLRVMLDDNSYGDRQYDNKNIGVYKSWPHAKVANIAYNLTSPYDTDMKVDASIQLKHMTTYLQVINKQSVYVPSAHLQAMLVEETESRNRKYLSAEGYGWLYYRAQRKNRMFWVLERLMLLAFIAVLSCWNEQTGVWLLVVGCVMSLVMSLIYFPSALLAGATTWARWMHQREDLNKKNAAIAHRQQDAFVSWPFNQEGMQEKLLRMKQRKEDRRYAGFSGVLRKAVVDPARKLRHSNFWWTRFWATCVELATGPCVTEFLRSVLLMFLVLGNKNVQILSNTTASVLAISTLTTSIVLLNGRSFWHGLANVFGCFKVMGLWIRSATLSCARVLSEPHALGDRIAFFFRQTGKVLTGHKNVSFFYASTGQVVRDSKVRDVLLVNNEVGLQLPGKVRLPSFTKTMRKLVGFFEKGRFDLHKTLFVSKPIYASRNVDTELPVQMSFRKFYTNRKGAEQSRLAATIQIVNHGLRNNSGVVHPQDDDSFLSLYTSPKFMPKFGDVKLKKKGHGYSVRYDPHVGTVTVKGPAVRPGVQYHLKSSSHRPAGEVSQSSLSSSSHIGGTSSSRATCSVPGYLWLKVGKGLSPDMYRCFTVKTPRGETFEIDPCNIKVVYDHVRRDLYLRHRGFVSNPSEYEVSWTVASTTKTPVDSKAKCEEAGIVHFPVDHAGTPDLYTWLVLRDENDACVDIDPSQTDAYQFVLPEQHYSGFVKYYYSFVRLLTDFAFYMTGRPFHHDTIQEPICCTVVQCVNPMEGVYRVDPNFQENIRLLNARIGELDAKCDSLEDPDSLQFIWPSLMTNADFVAFWRKHGVAVISESGFVNPLTERDHAHFQGQSLREAEGAFRSEIFKRIKTRISEIQGNLDSVRLWYKAYNDAKLYSTQLERDICDWKGDSAEVKAAAKRLSEHKRQYFKQIHNFVYPMSVHGAQICKKPNLNAQFYKWRRELEHWLTTEEAVLSKSTSQKGVNYLQNIIMDIIHALKMTSFRPENPAGNYYRTVLHYVTGSQMLRGPAAPWRPDPLTAMTALVRVFRANADGNPDFTSDPDWLPCCLKLSGGCIKILMPTSSDATRKFSSPNHWQQVLGWYVPLAAFQRVDVSYDPHLPAGSASNSMLKGMTGKLVFRKNQQFHIDDHYVIRNEDDEFEHVIQTASPGDPSTSVAYLILIGHCVDSAYTQNFPVSEQDRSIESFDGRVNVMPLTFRIAPQYLERWMSVVKNYQMDKPHNDFFDGTVRYGYDTTTPATTPTGTSTTPVTCVRADTSSSRVASPDSPTTSVPMSSGLRSARSGKYRGDMVKERYHGKGRLYDGNNNLVYSGQLANGKRWGHGVAYFMSNGGKWKYDGEFQDDKPYGKGSLTLITKPVVDESASYRTPHIIGASGTFGTKDPSSRIEHTLVRVEAPAASRPNIDTRFLDALLKRVRHEDDSSTSSSSGDHGRDSKVVINFDFDAARQKAGPEFTPSHEAVKAAESEYLPFGRWGSFDATALIASCLDAKIKYSGGFEYTGAINDEGDFHGKGRLVCYGCDLQFDGEFENGTPNGKASIVKGADNDTAVCYWGELRDGQRDGHGLLALRGKKIAIEGKFSEDKIADGKTKIHIHKDVAEDYPFRKYVGAIERELPHGVGKMTFKDGTSFRGTYNRGNRQGIGAIRDANKKVTMSGCFKDNGFGGRAGQVQLEDGTTYTGDLKDGKREGLGELYRDGKLIYEGQWDKDRPHGHGTLITKDGTYEGEFSGGKKSGKGRFVFKDRPLGNGKPRHYEGEWKDDKPHGVGKYLNENGIENVYKFQNGKITSDSAKAYKKGLCGKAPEMAASYEVSSCPIKPVKKKGVSDAQKVDFKKTKIFDFPPNFWAEHCKHKPYAGEAKKLASWASGQSNSVSDFTAK